MQFMLASLFRFARLLMSAACLALVASNALAEHAVIKLQITSPDGKQESFADQEPPAGGIKRRPRISVTHGKPLVFEFVLTNAYPHKQIEGVVVRYFVVRTGAFGSKEVPDLKASAVTEGTVNMNFKPKCRLGARLNVRIDEPGIYLVRVDTQNTQSDHEHFSAIDLEVK
jgi:hypothetical protein